MQTYNILAFNKIIKNKVKTPYLLDTFGTVLKFVAPQLEARDLMVSVIPAEE